MRNSGNFQQQPLMLNAESRSMRQLAVCLLAGMALTTTACTRMPVAHHAVVPEQVNAGKLQLVAQALVGTSSRYTDSRTGAAVEISVLSEYFSASGRTCRRFIESAPGGGTEGLACQDKKNGWIEIPIQSITD